VNGYKGVIAPNTAAQGTRSKDLLDWVEGSSGPGLAAADEVLQDLIPQATKTAPQPLAFVISGKISPSTAAELQAFVELLRKKTGDNSINIAFFQEGSIKLILNGSPEGLAKLQELFEAGELEKLDMPSVEAVTPVDSDSPDARKARLIQALGLRDQSSVNLYRFLARTIASDLSRASARDLDIDLSKADLSGANLRDIDLTGVDLTGADLAHANVTRTIFGDRSGFTEADKRDLQRRGAIFLDPPSSDVPALVLR
jgi:uncharacterized protein YjbI with pentapeptide repeats